MRSLLLITVFLACKTVRTAGAFLPGKLRSDVARPTTCVASTSSSFSAAASTTHSSDERKLQSIEEAKQYLSEMERALEAAREYIADLQQMTLAAEQAQSTLATTINSPAIMQGVSPEKATPQNTVVSSLLSCPRLLYSKYKRTKDDALAHNSLGRSCPCGSFTYCAMPTISYCEAPSSSSSLAPTGATSYNVKKQARSLPQSSSSTTKATSVSSPPWLLLSSMTSDRQRLPATSSGGNNKLVPAPDAEARSVPESNRNDDDRLVYQCLPNTPFSPVSEILEPVPARDFEPVFVRIQGG